MTSFFLFGNAGGISKEIPHTCGDGAWGYVGFKGMPPDPLKPLRWPSRAVLEALQERAIALLLEGLRMSIPAGSLSVYTDYDPYPSPFIGGGGLPCCCGAEGPHLHAAPLSGGNYVFLPGAGRGFESPARAPIPIFPLSM